MGHPGGWSALPRAGGSEGRGGCGCRFTNGSATACRCLLSAGDSRTVHPGGESVRRPSSVACGPPQPARPAPCTRAPRASHTRHQGVFRRLLRANSYEWLRGHVEGVLKICPASLQAADPLCMSPGKMQVSRRLTARWGHRGRLGRKLRLNAAGERSNLCCSRTVRINVISR